jgi:bifunctional UDP-N-acetylglucosamine pyrophosphorylase / glucosamine-1-phosphate N-acetyltransferase
MSDSIGIVILAAGKGTRMKVETPKALVPALGQALLDYVVSATLDFAAQTSLNAEVGVVVGHRQELLEAWWESHAKKSFLKLAVQKEQKGTADALKACFNDQPHFWNHTYTLVACADTPMITAKEFCTLFEVLKNNPELQGVAATFEAQNPTGYGRIVAAANGFHIVEEKDADETLKKITEVNSGVYILRTAHIKNVLGSISNNNKSGEFYLTDLFQDEFSVKAIKFPSDVPFLGINNMEQLAQVNGLLMERNIKKFYADGVMFLNPSSVYIEQNVKIGTGSIIHQGVTLSGQTSLGRNVLVEAGTVIKNSFVHDDVEILAHSYLEEAVVESHSSIGPMARLRPGTEVGRKSKIGNFVEVKKAKLAPGVKISHLSYVGDAEIGENTNIGCGFVTCNYDGVRKHKTKIGKNCFIGSDCQTIAPVEIGDDVFVAAGSTITKNIPSGGFAIARSQQLTKEGAAKRFLKVKKAE